MYVETMLFASDKFGARLIERNAMHIHRIRGIWRLSYEILNHNPDIRRRVIELVAPQWKQQKSLYNNARPRSRYTGAGPARQAYSLVHEICLPVLSLA